MIAYLQIENYHNRTEYATNGPQLHPKQSSNLSHMVKIYPKTLESIL
jgi:hypothetical protein